LKKIVVIGAGGLGREVADIIKLTSEKVIGFIDDSTEMQHMSINDIPVLGGIDWFTSKRAKGVYAVCAIGNNYVRKRITKKAEEMGVEFVSVIHPSVKLGTNTKIARGVIICAGSIITCNIRLGSHVFINLDCTIGHDTVLENYVNLAPGVHVSGKCTLKEGCHIYTGACLIPGVTMGEWSEAGAGAVILKNIDPYAVAVGVPAVIKNYREKPK
jgi:sugar O-acyltransferase (sialic acid O-acetyltransferase NeuD family)